MQTYPSLYSLLEKDSEASEYYENLPDYVKDSICQRAENVNSFASLQDYAENLTRGDN